MNSVVEPLAGGDRDCKTTVMAKTSSLLELRDLDAASTKLISSTTAVPVGSIEFSTGRAERKETDVALVVW